MFDSEFDDLGTPTLFPKTDINFYMMANNSSALQPWSKTTYKAKFDDHNQFSKQRMIKRRNFSFDSYQKAIKLAKRRLNNQSKHQVTLSTLTFYLSAEAPNPNEQKMKRRSSVNTVVKSRKNIFPVTPSKQMDPPLMMEGSRQTKGFTNTLRHTNLLKLKQQHQNKVKQIISRKDLLNNKSNGNVIRLNRFQRSEDIGKNNSNLPISLNNIVLDSEPRVAMQYLRRPKKVSFVGIRKILHMSNQKQH